MHDKHTGAVGFSSDAQYKNGISQNFHTPGCAMYLGMTPRTLDIKTTQLEVDHLPLLRP